MLAPRATKTSSLTSASQATARQGHQQTRRQVVEEVEERDEFDDASAMDVVGEAEDDEPEESQNTADGSIEHLMVRMVEDQRKRLATRKKAVNNAYNTSRETTQNTINGLFDEHEEKASAVHEAQLKRLRELLAHKAKIETAMADKLTSLRASYDAHSRDLEAVVDRRIKEMK